MEANRIKSTNFFGLILGFIIIIYSCKKDDDYQYRSTPPKNNKPAVAIAGSDTIVFLPEVDFINLDASRSYDPEGLLHNTYWQKISGPDLKGFKVSDAKIAIVNFLDTGLYQFELTVSDIWSASSKDTVTVTVKWGNNCNQNRQFKKAGFLTTAVSENIIPIDASFNYTNDYLFFAGGTLYFAFWPGEPFLFTSDLTIYKANQNKWVTKKLSEARTHISSVMADGKLFLAGGLNEDKAFNTVDIYDPISDTFTKTVISVARSSIASATAGDKILFAGGNTSGFKSFVSYSDVVDIYDLKTKTWSTSKLSVKRKGISAITAGNKIYFAGGESEGGEASGIIDIYDAATGIWSIAQLKTPRIRPQAVFLGTNIAFTGGYKKGGEYYLAPINSVEYFDVITHATTTDCIFNKVDYNEYQLQGTNLGATPFNNALYYLNNGLLQKYDLQKKAWTIANAPEKESIIFTLNNELYTIHKFYHSEELVKYELYKIIL